MTLRSVAYAVVHSNPPNVYLAADIDVLQRLLAIELVCRVDPTEVDPVERDRMRQALLDERWGEAVLAWIEHTSTYVDVYTNLQIYREEDLPAELVGAQLQFTPLFRD